MNYLILVVLHICLAAMWFGAPMMMGSVLKRSAAAGPAAFAAGARVANRMALLGGIGCVGALLTGLSLVFMVYGGLSRLPIPFHVALSMVLLGVVLSLGAIWPATRRLALAAQAEGYSPSSAGSTLKQLTMMSGVNHTLWLGSLICMYAAKLF